MGNFLNLSAALMGASLLKIVRVEVKRLSDELDNCLAGKRDPLFHAELGFDKDGRFYNILNLKAFLIIYGCRLLRSI
jgi:hypothetical protein